jgi:metallo-beta-lactamase family protein
VTVRFHDAGHILGAASVEIVVTGDGPAFRLFFSGDLGRRGAPIMRDPEDPVSPDCLFVESTYGDRDHKGENSTLEELAEAVACGHANLEKVIIPAFAVERTQELLYCLRALHMRGKLPADMPVFVDSPLAIRATQVFGRYRDYFDDEAADLPLGGERPFDLPNLRYTLRAEESRAVNELKGPAVVLSASGMCNAGRIKHHLRHNLWKPGACVVFTGYQGVGTLGRKIVDGAKSVRIFGEDVAVRAGIFTIGGFSAHAGQSQLLEWIGKAVRPGLHIVLTHGEARAQRALAALIRRNFDLEPLIPDYLDTFDILPGKAPAVSAAEAARPEVDWDCLARDAEDRWMRLKAKVPEFRDLPWEEQTELRDRMLKMNSELARFLNGQ